MIFNSNLWQCHSLKNYSNQLLVYCFHQSATHDIRENLDFAVEWQNHVINVYGCVCHYMEVPSEPCTSFREIKAISSKLTVFLLYLIYFLYFGEILAKTGVGQTSAISARWDPGGSRLIQGCPVTSQIVIWCQKSNIFQKTKFAKTNSWDGLREFPEVQKCKHFVDMTFS